MERTWFLLVAAGENPLQRNYKVEDKIRLHIIMSLATSYVRNRRRAEGCSRRKGTITTCETGPLVAAGSALIRSCRGGGDQVVVSWQFGKDECVRLLSSDLPRYTSKAASHMDWNT